MELLAGTLQEPCEGSLRVLGREWRHLKPTAGDDILRLRQGPWRILLAVDDSGPAARAAETAAVMTEPCCGEVLVFRAREVEGSGRTPSLETPASPAELVGHVVEMLRGEGVRVRGEAFTTTRGETARDIVEEARHREADLIIMGSRGLPDLVALFRGAESLTRPSAAQTARSSWFARAVVTRRR